MTTLFSLSDTAVPFNLTKQCYEYRVSKTIGLDSSVNHFEQSVNWLANSIVQILDLKGNKMLCVANPSISQLSRNTLDALRIFNQLYTKGVELRFELEHLSSNDKRVRQMFAMLAVVEQEESCSKICYVCEAALGKIVVQKGIQIKNLDKTIKVRLQNQHFHIIPREMFEKVQHEKY